MSNEPYSEQYRIIAKRWVDADAAAQLLEETKGATLAQRQLSLGDIPVSRAEVKAKSDPAWMIYLENMVEARKTANLLKVQLKYLEMKGWEQRSFEATQRAEMKL